MATAVIISGQARTFDRCYPTQRWHVFRNYEPDIHFFVSVANDADAYKMEVLREHYENVHIEKVDDPTDLPDIPDDLGAHAPYANAANHKQLLLQHWSNKRAYDFFCERNPGDRDFNTFIRIRTDLFFHRFQKPNDEIGSGGLHPGTIFTPWWGKFGGVNDRFAIMGADAAFYYFRTFVNIRDLLSKGCPFHPESLVAASLEAGGIGTRCFYEPLMASFSTLRKDGQQRWPEITSEDIAELIATRS